uniref:DNA-directed RNA polymerase n=1 Tax=Wrangelia sp. TaxID=2575620 RepID=A0A4D6X5N4_9FLOR|nr:RNA polymerase b'-subunit [Wrangelia sp.]
MNKQIPNIPFFNRIIDKSQLKKLITWSFRNYGMARASSMVDQLKDLGFFYATKAGISLSLEDLRIPPSKNSLLQETFQSISSTDHRYKRGEITAVERFQKIIDTWNYASESLKLEVIHYFKKTDPLNSIYMMAFSGARANISQVRQLVGMRGLMSDPQGQIIDLPIASNFREGLTITDYFISSYGARKGLVDTALRTADSGYLTRRLVDVAQDVIIREYDCGTSKGILLEDMCDNDKVMIDLKQALIGRVLAEDIINLNSNSIVAKSGQDISPLLADEIIKLKLKRVLVRSPLTCSSIKSVCQLCYGWNLAHGKMVDLGEAIGIIAAQSIGEPGTQLTMRTFHTGGVFTGELNRNIVSNLEGQLKYVNNIICSQTRTKHGDYAMLVHNDSKVKVINKSKQEDIINIFKGSLLLVDNDDYIKSGQIIAQYPLNNHMKTEKAQKTIVADFSGSVHFIKNNLLRSNDYSKNKTMSHYSLWVLSGQVYNVSSDTQLLINNNDYIQKDGLIARTELISRYNGLVKILYNNKNVEFPQILLITSSKLLNNCTVWIDKNNDYKNYILEISNKDKFILKNCFYKRISNNQIIADLVSNAYKTNTGGILKYLDLSLVKHNSRNDQKDIYNILGSGYILWIPEETHLINKDISLLLVQNGQFVEAGTEIIQNTFSKNTGILEITEKEGIIREIVIKPCQYYELQNYTGEKIYKQLGKLKGFLRPGEILVENIVIDNLSYWEYTNISGKNIILIRPVTVYSVPSKLLSFDVSDDSFETHNINLKLIRRTNFKDGERIKSITGINLITTHLSISLSEEVLNLQCSIELEKDSTKGHFFMKFITTDLLSLKDSSSMNTKDLYTKTSILIKNNTFIKAGSVVAQTDIFSHHDGKILYLNQIKTINKRVLIINHYNTKTFSIKDQESICVKVKDWVYAGDYLAKDTKTEYSGQILSIIGDQIILQTGQPYLISSGSFLHIENNSLVKKGENLVTLIYEKSKTGDIVQGLPRIEEILEARKKTDHTFNPHLILEGKFRFYLNNGLTLYDSTRLSFLEIQLLLVKEVQTVYQSQGVDISDKHIEVIVRQMTSKVRIEIGGDSEYLPGEILEFKKIESINKSLFLMNKQQATYYPILLGITKSSLNTDSFISAASFQETTKVLTDAAISGKLDWLRGLKENVIIGRLIPAGTGFKLYNHINNAKESNNSSRGNGQNLLNTSQDNFEDIIVDDRNINIYSAYNE